ncbi:MULTISPECIES: hypothetical protein [unclassified Sporosarcina]|uniref:hypothetical protein n=1 Tax=unclassified Sporosarcina TaxID=2647733 RepID=UPI0020402AEE|nr:MULTISPECIES: hypothetical protein [unclassified Sporosarcina]GKV67095.1 hypothetical protein NCCP2331_32480 [Sporosarcina sp. NCCP-2331]GLB57430.1 hypothetical protein NCCP2378_32180 [Sporosarcina sp. NCCP-2378]
MSHHQHIKSFSNKVIDKLAEIEVTSFNLEHRLQDNRWAGKSVYKLTGISYKVKKGCSYVYIETALEQQTSDEILEGIERAIREYLALPDIQEIILNDKYLIQLVNSYEELLVELNYSHLSTLGSD